MPSRFFLALFTAGVLSAAPITTNWTGPSGGSWTTAGNWSTGVAQNSPGNDYNATFSSVSSTRNILLTTDATISGLSMGDHNTVTIDAGKTLTLDSGTFSSSGLINGNVAISGAATVSFTGGGGMLGTLTNSSTGQVTFQDTQAGSLVNAAGGVINLNGSIEFSGSSISNDGSVSVSGTLGNFNTLHVSGAGTLTLANASLSGNGTLNNSSTIKGSGTIDEMATNSGAIEATGGSLIFGDNVLNSGTLQADSGSTVTLQKNLNNSGTVKAEAGSTMTIDGAESSTSTGSLIADGGTLNLQHDNTFDAYYSSVVAQNGGHVEASTRLSGTATVHSTGILDLNGIAVNLTVDSGGTANLNGGGANTLNNSGNVAIGTADITTNSFTNNASGTVTISGGGSLFLEGSTFTNNGSIQMTGGLIDNERADTLSGSGTLNMSASSLSGERLTNSASHTIQGSGSISLFLTNNGSLIASGGDLSFAASDRPFTNNGLVKAAGGNVLITSTSPTPFTNYASGILTGGTYEADGSHSIQFAGADITTSNANIVLVDGGRILDSTNTSKDGLRDFLRNNGTFDLENTTFNAASNDFFNNGHVVVGEGSHFNVHTGDKLANQAGGLVSGTGTINGDVDNEGTVSPGDDPGTLTVTGAYHQGSAAELDLEFATDSSWSELWVSGNAQLDGTLNIVVDSTFDAALGSTFEIMRAGSVTGGFDTFLSGDFHGKTFQLDRTAAGFDLEVVSQTTPEPATFSMMLLTLAGCFAVWSRRGSQKKQANS